MNVNIGILYPSRLTLYGESGNVKALQYYLKKEEIDAEIEYIDDLSSANLNKIDFLYIGSGLETGLNFAELNMFDNKKKISDYIENGGFFLVTGNAMYTFKHYNYFKVNKSEDYHVADVTAKELESKIGIRAFQNSKYSLVGTENPVFELYTGFGNDGSKKEGFRYKNLIVTSLIGPILAINAEYRNYIIDRIKENNGNNSK